MKIGLLRCSGRRQALRPKYQLHSAEDGRIAV